MSLITIQSVFLHNITLSSTQIVLCCRPPFLQITHQINETQLVRCVFRIASHRITTFILIRRVNHVLRVSHLANRKCCSIHIRFSCCKNLMVLGFKDTCTQMLQDLAWLVGDVAFIKLNEEFFAFTVYSVKSTSILGWLNLIEVFIPILIGEERVV